MGDTPLPATPDASPEGASDAARSLEDAERRALVGALAADVGHELAGALTLFRLTVDRLEAGAALDAEELSVLREELEHLSRLRARLRELARRPPEPRVVPVKLLLDAALGRLEHPRRAALELAVPEQATLRCDP